MSSLTTTQPAKGLEGVVATTSSICYIDGEQGVLAYRGIDIHELADNANFEETCNLLWFGKLPTRNELKDLRERLARERHLDPAIINLLQTAPKNITPMDVLRTRADCRSLRNWHCQPVRECRYRGRPGRLVPRRYSRCWKWWRPLLPSP